MLNGGLTSLPKIVVRDCRLVNPTHNIHFSYLVVAGLGITKKSGLAAMALSVLRYNFFHGGFIRTLFWCDALTSLPLFVYDA